LDVATVDMGYGWGLAHSENCFWIGQRRRPCGHAGIGEAMLKVKRRRQLWNDLGNDAVGQVLFDCGQWI